mmetsp:Transcript_12339/g.39064  ORF Transcript_12339/g.39064 Transcript_12339/m.39064 type:complete len:331 (+) Transcript_12339:594-1586(+)
MRWHRSHLSVAPPSASSTHSTPPSLPSRPSASSSFPRNFLPHAIRSPSPQPQVARPTTVPPSRLPSSLHHTPCTPTPPRRRSRPSAPPSLACTPILACSSLFHCSFSAASNKPSSTVRCRRWSAHTLANGGLASSSSGTASPTQPPPSSSVASATVAVGVGHSRVPWPSAPAPSLASGTLAAPPCWHAPAPWSARRACGAPSTQSPTRCRPSCSRTTLRQTPPRPTPPSSCTRRSASLAASPSNALRRSRCRHCCSSSPSCLASPCPPSSFWTSVSSRSTLGPLRTRTMTSSSATTARLPPFTRQARSAGRANVAGGRWPEVPSVDTPAK